MGEPLHRSSDAPGSDPYPAVPRQSSALPEGKPALEQIAIQIGATLGKAVVVLRSAPDKIKAVAEETRGVAASRMNDLAGTARARAEDAAARVAEITDDARVKAQEWTEAAASRAEEMRRAAAERAAELRSRARARFSQARLQANQVVHDHPLQVVLAAGAVGLVLGAVLRVWRSNRESS
jgi:ElaB/YqjD/DUF883 family membrane-anchored ribosome-binding protein